MLLGIINSYQKLVVMGFSAFGVGKARSKICVASTEIANNIFFYKKVFGDGCITVIKNGHAYYAYVPDIKYPLRKRSGLLSFLVKAVIAPYIFVYCLRECDTFFYVWDSSLLEDREFEFKFLKRHGRQIINRFLGCDIRHWEPALKELNDFGRFHVCNLCKFIYSSKCSKRAKQETAALADKYANLVYADAGMPSFLKSRYKRTRIPLDLTRYKYSFETCSKPIIVHAPSDPVLKGTHIIRLAINTLRRQGYIFKYVELQEVKNEIVVDWLGKSHIVIDQLGGIGSGLFALEAMACGNIVLSGANPVVNPDLPCDCPIISVTPITLRERLEWVLVNRGSWEDIAARGREYVEKYHAVEIVARGLRADIQGLTRKH